MPLLPKTAEAFAPAKINLTLHVTGQRDDGYHLIDSLVGFADVGDVVRVRPAEQMSIRVTGPHAAGVPDNKSNLVWRAADWFGTPPVEIELLKRLPTASGIGGGSSDAAACLKALSQVFGKPLPRVSETAVIGADVPVCLLGQPCRMSGTGERIEPYKGLPVLDILLVNPGVHASTPHVFKSLTSKSNRPMPESWPVGWAAEPFCDWLSEQRNDLTPAAIHHCPEIATALGILDETDALFAGMSGSGATCFGLFLPDGHSAKAARAHLRETQPDWWAVNTRLRLDREESP